MEPIDTFKREWPEVKKAGWSVLSLVVVTLVIGLGVYTYLSNAVLSGKDATIETLKAQEEGFKNERDDLAKKLDSMSGKDATIESLNNRIATLEADKADLNKKLASASNAGANEVQAIELSKAEADRDRAALQHALTSSRNEISELKDQLNKTTHHQQSENSSIVGLDDARRFQIVKTITDGMLNFQPQDTTCDLMVATVPLTPALQRTFETWSEIQQPLFYAGWRYFGGTNSFIPPGISIVAEAQSGHSYQCGRHLKDLLDGLNVRPVSFRVDAGSPDLAACKNVYKRNECIGVTVGELESP
jgi:hypothetical protein